jgi:hypothetical protein
MLMFLNMNIILINNFWFKHVLDYNTNDGRWTIHYNSHKFHMITMKDVVVE